MITKFSSFLQEAIKLSHAKDYTKQWKSKGLDKRFEKEFGGKYRIYTPLLNIQHGFRLDKNLKNEIETLLQTNGYEIVNYYENLCKKVDGKSLQKITKVLNSLKQQFLTIEYNEELMSFGKFSDGYTVVISRHPIDIVGMSTGRGWTSCMNLEDGKLKQALLADIDKGTLIAYLILDTDTNIEAPIARVSLKPFLDENEKVWYFPDKVYGTENQYFYNTVIEWLKSFQGESPVGKYEIEPLVYSDTPQTKYVVGNDVEKIKEILDQLGVEVYDIHDDFSVTINQDAMYTLSNFGGGFPFKIREINGKCFFNDLTTFENFPDTINGDVRIDDFDQRDFSGISKNINGNLSVFFSKFSDPVSFKGFPKNISGFLMLKSMKSANVRNLNYLQKTNIKTQKIFIEKLFGLSDLTFLPKNLKSVSIMFTDLKSTNGVETLKHLETLNLLSNQLETLTQFDNPNLKEIEFGRNAKLFQNYSKMQIFELTNANDQKIDIGLNN